MSEEQEKPLVRAPRGLSKSAREVYVSVLTDYELRPDETRILTDYCRELTIIDTLEAATEGADLMVRASHGGMQINPILSELRYRRQAALAIWKSLKLQELSDDEEEDELAPRRKMTRSEAAKHANDVRWKKV